MSSRQYALILSLVLACAQAARSQTSVAPQSGVLVLRNGYVLEGDVTRAGDYYIVSRGEGSELKIKSDEVELFCGSMNEVYEFKVRHLSDVHAKPHVELAKWCLRHAMYDECTEQLAVAKRLESDSAEVKELETRLKFVLETPSPTSTSRASPVVPPEEMEKALRDLPRGSVEKFGAIVQPILLNRCAANQCHGPNSKSDFRLLRPPPGQIVSRRFTQRNLYAALKQLNSANPEASPLVALPQQRHGNSLSAVFDKHSGNQLAELIAWAKMTASPITPAPHHPTTIPATETTLSQPAASATPSPAAPQNAPVNEGSKPGEISDQSIRATIRLMRPAIDGANNTATDPAAAPWRPRDPFDPEIFNRRYHGK